MPWRTRTSIRTNTWLHRKRNAGPINWRTRISTIPENEPRLSRSGCRSFFDPVGNGNQVPYGAFPTAHYPLPTTYFDGGGGSNFAGSMSTLACISEYVYTTRSLYVNNFIENGNFTPLTSR